VAAFQNIGAARGFQKSKRNNITTLGASVIACRAN
jgi:hypothetical protein